MSRLFEVFLPDIGDFENVAVIEILVSVGDRVAREDSLITVESDKASMEIPSPRGGLVSEICVELGSLVSEGSLVLKIETEDSAKPATKSAAKPATESRGISDSQAHSQQSWHAAAKPATVSAAKPATTRSSGSSDVHAEVVVLGGGPGGYTAAFRASDLGAQVVLIERYDRLGGVCLNVGCIPSKALLHIAEVINETRELRDRGVDFGNPTFDLPKLRAFRDRVVGGLTDGLKGLAGRRKVSVLQGYGRFSAPDQLTLETAGGAKTVSFGDCIIAAGSHSMQLAGIPHDDPRVMDSTDALEIEEIPERLLVIGGGIIGLEMATIYDALGSRVSVVELTDELIPGCDRDLVKPLQKRITKRYENIFLRTQVSRIEAEDPGLRVYFEGREASDSVAGNLRFPSAQPAELARGRDAPASDLFDRVLVAVGRKPNGNEIGAAAAGVEVDARGFIRIDEKMRTTAPHIYAIGDITGPPMLAHKATHEGKTAAEVIAGLPSAFDAKTIPSVAYTDPEIAWMGLSEADAVERGVEYTKASFPWAASGRAQGIGRPEGVTKLIFAAETRRILGAGMVGRNAGELISEAVLALEMGADAEDLALTVHPHPTLSETLHFASEMAEGTITDLYIPKRRTPKRGA